MDWSQNRCYGLHHWEIQFIHTTFAAFHQYSKEIPRSCNITSKVYELINAKFLLQCALFTDVPAEAKHFSLTTQEQNIDIIRILASVENTKHNHERLLQKLWKNLAYVFQLPTVKFVTEEIESNDEDGETMSQNQKVQFYSREKYFIEHHIVQIVERVVSCFGKCYGNLYSNLEETSIKSPQMTVIVLFLTCVVYWIAMFGQMFQMILIQQPSILFS